jgi:leucyl-tRNA synthetase
VTRDTTAQEPLDTKAQLDEYKAKSETPYTEFWKEVATPEIEKWLPADWYLGGAEHAVLHLLYARFWVKVLRDLELLSFPEPFLRLRSVGMVLAEDGRKMSKSWGNVINPDDMVREFGSDAVRLYEMFMGPWDQAIAWDTRSLVGQQRFLERVISTAKMEGKIGEVTSPGMQVALAKLVKRVESAIVEQKFNTAIAGMMELVNLWRSPAQKASEDQTMSREDLGILARVMSPFAPKTAQELWEKCSDTHHSGQAVTPCHKQSWPTMDSVKVEGEMVKIAVQVNGKLRGIVEVASDKAKVESEVVAVALADEKVKKHVVGEPKKIIFVPGKILNLVG